MTSNEKPELRQYVNCMLAETEKTELLQLARSALESHFKAGKIPECDNACKNLQAHKGAFVSLHNEGRLRGCIGQLSPDKELFKVVQSCVLSAALEDPRFLPVTADEIPDLNIEISVLTPFQRVRNHETIEVGKHGLLVTRGFHRGLLLPQVATEYGWDRETFLAQTCRKAGLPELAWRDPETIVHTFEAEVFSDQKQEEFTSTK
jgi:AmmeMemoRadiSam system protein A